MLEDIAARLFAAIGIKGVSTVVLVLLVSMALYVHKAATVGSTVVTLGSTVQHDLKVIALVLLLLLLGGVIHADPGRAQELIMLGQQQLAELRLLERARGWVL